MKSEEKCPSCKEQKKLQSYHMVDPEKGPKLLRICIDCFVKESEKDCKKFKKYEFDMS